MFQVKGRGFWFQFSIQVRMSASRACTLLCVIDDAHWLDRASAQALGFVARRLLAEPVAFLVAAREPSGEFTGLPELIVGGLVRVMPWSCWTR